MYELQLTSVPEWRPVQSKWCPLSVDTRCPFCGKMVNLTFEGYQWDPPRKTIAAHARCAGCGESVRFWIVDPGDTKDGSQKDCKAAKTAFGSVSPLSTLSS